MTKQEKELLLKDLCARLPYNVTVRAIYDKPVIKTLGLGTLHDFMYDNISDVKPYLRPMSSMTEKEAEELDEMNICNHTIAFYNRFKEEPHFFAEYNVIGIIDTMKYIDWLIAHYFDFRGLITMGAALPAPDGMYDF